MSTKQDTDQYRSPDSSDFCCREEKPSGRAGSPGPYSGDFDQGKHQNGHHGTRRDALDDKGDIKPDAMWLREQGKARQSGTCKQ